MEQMFELASDSTAHSNYEAKILNLNFNNGVYRDMKPL